MNLGSIYKKKLREIFAHKLLSIAKKTRRSKKI